MRFLLLACLMYSLPVGVNSAESKKEEAAVDWSDYEPLTSEKYATEGEALVGSSALSLQDGRHVLITYWRGDKNKYARCFDFYSPTMELISAHCSSLGY